MTPQQHQRIKELFLKANEMPPADRSAFLDQACGDDTELRREVRSLLDENEAATAAFLQPISQRPTNLSKASESPPERIGPYRVVRELGHGGMGAVYLAVRDGTDFRQRVAIKIIKRGMDTEDILRRFKLERQVLASMNHPNIARLLDGGSTEDGRPYFVMEHIEGSPIDQYCDERRLRISERLKLFQQVCAGIHYAHQNLVVHRDLKPGNVLVTPQGVAKIVDFGIAKLLQPVMSPVQIDPTAAALRLMTPEYASPEQVRGAIITTASDVYSLGVLLFELLTGRRPYRLRTRLRSEIERVICEEAPERPSTAISRVDHTDDEPERASESDGKSDGETRDHTTKTITAESISLTREGKPDRLRRRLSGDIDNIVLKALRKEPQRRYVSAEQFSEDLRRHLDGLPVMARPVSISYRLTKFVRRNRLGVIAAAALFLSLFGGVIATTWQARVAAYERDVATAERDRAQRRFDEVRQLAHVFMYDFHDAVKKLAGSTPARELLVTSALKYLDTLASEVSDNPDLQRELATAYFRVGDIQGGVRGGNLGDTAGALRSHEAALRLRTALLERSPDDAELSRDVYLSHLHLGDILRKTGDSAAALARYESAVRSREKASANQPGDLTASRDFSVSLLKMGDALQQTGDLAGARSRFERALEIRKDLVERSPDDRMRLMFMRDLAVGHGRLGALFGMIGEPELALNQLESSLNIRSELAEAEPDSGRARRDLAMAHLALGDLLLDLGRTDEALRHDETLLLITQSLRDADAPNARAQRDLLMAHQKLGAAYLEAGRLDEAMKELRVYQSQALLMTRADPANATLRRILASSHALIGDVQMRIGDRESALDSYKHYMRIASQDANSDPTSAPTRRNLALAHLKLGQAHESLDHRDEAADHFEQAIDILRRELRDHGDDRISREHLAEALTSRGGALARWSEYAAARLSIDEAVSLYEKLQPKAGQNIALAIDLAGALHELADVLTRLGEDDEADDADQRAIETLRGAKGNKEADELRRSIEQ